MPELLTYQAKVAVLIAMFCLCYRLLLSRESFHRVNRVVLLASLALSFVLPLCVFTMHQTVTLPMPTVEVGQPMAVMGAIDDGSPLWPVVVGTLYKIGVLAVLVHMLVSVARVVLLIRRSERHRQPDGTVVCMTGSADVSPFSFFRYIVMNRDDFARCDSAVMAHERGHVRLHHSWDVLLVDFLTALQWFNPAMWLMRSYLRAVHEYEADGEVLSQGVDMRQYQYLLIQRAVGSGGYSIVNGITHSTLKNRIYMMLHRETTNRTHLLKLLALLPIIGTALALNARTVTDVIYQHPVKKPLVKKGKQNATTQLGNQQVEVVATGQAVTQANAPADNKKYKLKGQVYSTGDMQPVVGAVVRIAGSKKGTVSDAEGRFTLEASPSDLLEVTYVGMKTTKMPAHNIIEGMKLTGLEAQVPMFKEQEPAGDKVFDVVEQMPQFPGGPTDLAMYLSENLRYPAEAENKKIQGRVIVNFVVEKDGSINNAKIMRSIDPLLDAEALRVVNAMPRWTPGTQSGKPVRVKYTVPITFRLDSGQTTEEKNIVIGKEHKGSEYEVELDGKLVDAATLNGLEPGSIEQMQVQKAKDGQPNDKIIITTKKKK